ncbi:transglutaminase-like domain-containing protein [Pseudonocardia sp. H11422]|uniref:transglutaminase-like domain-containing protein n=1 Tax=Pseudonocardia sp. H11422 TaxID=2835866 RepID=UPI001BDD9BD2|nr:transglutaminase family protein [Pseudonocardia sp. H11422]
MHVLDAASGALVVDYAATVDGMLPAPPPGEQERLPYLRPSRWCPSDRLLATAGAEFGGISESAAIVDAVTGWVGERLRYVAGAGAPTDDAVDTLLLGEGVCRDFAHLVTGLLRALDVAARLAAVYAPGLAPMDFHGVVEACTGEQWGVVDATGLVRGRRCCGSRPAATPPTPRSSAPTMAWSSRPG